MKRDIHAFDIIVLVLLLYAFLLNLIPFVPMLIEQIEVGYGTYIEMGALIYWLIQIITIPAIIIGIIYFVIGMIKKYNKKLFAVNTLLLFSSLLFIIFSNIFIFY